MELAAFLASVVLISLSGVLAPGPLLAATIAEGRTNRFAGFFITLGHALFEIPIILGLFVFGTVAASQSLQSAIGLIGGIVLLFFAYRDCQRAVRDDRYKLIEYYVDGTRMTQLFDLAADPWELTNLADESDYADELARLREQLSRWQVQVDDPLATP